MPCVPFQRSVIWAEGYHNVTWVGDRKALPHQLNGKSSNINHMVLNRMYPHVQSTKDVPYKDILMVMDCDHLVEPEFFAKCCAVMLDRDVAVCSALCLFHHLLSLLRACIEHLTHQRKFDVLLYVQVCLVPQSFHNEVRPVRLTI